VSDPSPNVALAFVDDLARIARMLRFVVAAACSLAVFASCNPETPKFAFKSAERRGVLNVNGMRFVIMPDPTTELVEVDVHYDVGSREDPRGKAGLAHLVEHLMFQTRPDGPNTAPIFQTLLDISTFMNAFTSWDMTHYWTTVRKEHLDDMLKIEAMRMYYAADLPSTDKLPAFGCSTVPSSEFEREREVVRNEIRAQSSAEDYVVQLVESNFYPDGHAYQRLVGGNDQQIAGAQLSDACEFMKKYYAPERATVIIAGGVDVEETVKLIEKWFSAIPKRTATPRVDVAAFQPTHEKREIQADVERPSVWIGWALPPGNTPEGEAARFGIGSAFGRIAQKADQYGFAYKVEPAILGGELAPLFLVRIELKSMGRLDEALEFAEKAAKQAYRGWDEGTYEELEEEKNREKASFIAGLEALPQRTLSVGTMVQFEKDMDFNSQQMYLFHALDKIDRFDNARVGSAVKKALAWDKAGILVVKPNKEGLKGDTRASIKFVAQGDQALAKAAVDPTEAKRPLKVSAQLKGLADAQRFTMSNGMEVVLLPSHAMPLARAVLMFKNVGDANTPTSPALGAAAAAFLHRVGDVDPNGAINSDVFSRTGIDVGCSSNEDTTVCSSHGVNIYLEVMVKGLERLVTAGEYTQESIERFQKRVREDWKLHSTQEENEYAHQVYAALFGPDHPYTKTAIITPDAAGKLHRDALEGYRRKYFTAGNATLILVGDFKPEYAEKLARSTFGDWGKGTVAQPVDPKVAPRTAPTFVGVLKNKPDQQVTVTIGYPAPAGVDGQEGARRVLAEMMNFRAEDVRFKLGSTYGLYFGRRPHTGPTAYLMGGGAVVGGTIDAERAGESIKALRESLDALRKGDDKFDEDFARARRNLISKLLGESTVTAEIAARLSFIATYGRDTNYYNQLLQQIAATSPAQIRALMKSELDPNHEIVVMLGDKAHVDKAFADAGITDVKIVEPDYK
jgi:zinc protease